MKTALLASAIALSLTGASYAQTASPTVANPPSQGKAAPTTANETGKMKSSGGGAMTNPQQTPGGQMGPSGQQAKPK